MAANLQLNPNSGCNGKSAVHVACLPGHQKHSVKTNDLWNLCCALHDVHVCLCVLQLGLLFNVCLADCHVLVHATSMQLRSTGNVLLKTCLGYVGDSIISSVSNTDCHAHTYEQT